MIKVKKGNCQLIGNKREVFSELTVAIVSCAEIMAKDLNKTIEEAIDILAATSKESYRRTKDYEGKTNEADKI